MAEPPIHDIVEIAIESVGARGDGVGRVEDRLVYVACTAPGDRVRAEIVGERGEALVGRLLEVVEAGRPRVAPPCPHFGPCGGCALQHLAAPTYREWKREQVATALRRRG